MNFPAGIPSTTLRRTSGSEPFLHLTDGGEADNLGIVVASAIQNYEAQAARKSGSHSIRQLLIVIDAFVSSASEFSQSKSAPGIVGSIKRATDLPLDAHRYRVKRDFYNSDIRHLSILDALAKDNDVAVAYIDIGNEVKAKSVATSLGISEEEQRALICAGKRRALSALGASKDDWSNVRNIGVRCFGFPQSQDTEILAFTTSEKRDFVALLSKGCLLYTSDAADE